MSSSQSRRDRRAQQRAREARVRASGIDPTELFAWANGELDRVTPPGWGRKKVVPAWAGIGGKCRACGGGERWTVIMLTRMNAEERVVLYTFAFVCDGCLGDADRTRELGDRAFALQ